MAYASGACREIIFAKEQECWAAQVVCAGFGRDPVRVHLY